MSYTLDFSQTGLMIVSGDRDLSIHLRSISTYAPNDVTVNYEFGRDDVHEVILNENNGVIKHRFDIRDITSPVYATTQDLVDDINDAVEAMYAGGGGGGSGTMTSVSIASANGISGTSNGDPETPTLTLEGNALIRNVLTIGHGLLANEAVRLDGANVVLATGDTFANAALYGFVWSVTNADVVKVALPGSYMPSGFTGLTAGTLYYLDPSTPGALTATPNGFGPVLYATSTTGGNVLGNAQSIDRPRILAMSLSNLGGPADPDINGLYNELGGTPTVTRAGDGNYLITLTGAFTESKTHVHVGRNRRQDWGFNMWRWISADEVDIWCADITGTDADPVSLSIVIEVTP